MRLDLSEVKVLNNLDAVLDPELGLFVCTRKAGADLTKSPPPNWAPHFPF